LVLIFVGGLLILIGFLADLIGTASLNDSSTLASIQVYREAYDAFVGLGVFLAVLGYLCRQFSSEGRHE
jgi:hypothetical protein